MATQTPLREGSAAAGRQATGYTRRAASAGGGLISNTAGGGGSTGWAIVGYSLALILLYVLIADKRVVSATTGLFGGATTAAKTWVEPKDPLALLESKLGYTPGSSSSPSSNTTGANAPAVPENTAAAAAAAATGAAPAPGMNAAALKTAKRKYGTVSQRVYEPIRKQRVKEGIMAPLPGEK